MQCSHFSPMRQLKSRRGWLGGICAPSSPLRMARRTAVLVGVAAIWSLIGGYSAEPAAAVDAGLIRQAVVAVKATIPADATSSETLGTEREGSGVVIGESGLILTIGYLMLEADSIIVTDADGREFPADPLAYDFESGFGLVRAFRPFDAKPVPLGDSGRIEKGAPLLAVAFGDPRPVSLLERRTYAGYWEYLMEGALFTTPQHPGYGGAALFDRSGALVGIGSLSLTEETGAAPGEEANMFVPTDALKPILDAMIRTGRREGTPRPWLGVYPREVGRNLVVGRVAPRSPAFDAGLEKGDRIVAIDGIPVDSLETFYRELWDLGISGVLVPLEVVRRGRPISLTVKSADRYRFLKLRQTY